MNEAYAGIIVFFSIAGSMATGWWLGIFASFLLENWLGRPQHKSRHGQNSGKKVG